jgi:hypothetical protein
MNYKTIKLTALLIIFSFSSTYTIDKVDVFAGIGAFFVGTMLYLGRPSKNESEKPEVLETEKKSSDIELQQETAPIMSLSENIEQKESDIQTTESSEGTSLKPLDMEEIKKENEALDRTLSDTNLNELLDMEEIKKEKEVLGRILVENKNKLTENNELTAPDSSSFFSLKRVIFGASTLAVLGFVGKVVFDQYKDKDTFKKKLERIKKYVKNDLYQTALKKFKAIKKGSKDLGHSLLSRLS